MKKNVERALKWALPRRAARFVVLETQLWASLLLWLFRRRRPGTKDFTYHKNSILGVFIIAALFSSPVEILLFEFLIPWAWLRWLLLVASVYTVFWVLGFYASLATLPHRLEADGIRLHYGVLAGGFVPYAAIAEVAREQRKPPRKSQGLSLSPDQSTAYFSMDGATNIVLRLAAPQQMRGFLNLTPPVTTIFLAVDEPARFVEQLRQRLDAAGTDAATATTLERTSV
jgi:hypothetical protein